MPFIPHTEEDIKEMLAAIGASGIDSLFDEIPAELLIEDLDGVPAALTEMEVSRLMHARAARDGSDRESRPRWMPRLPWFPAAWAPG